MVHDMKSSGKKTFIVQILNVLITQQGSPHSKATSTMYDKSLTMSFLLLRPVLRATEGTSLDSKFQGKRFHGSQNT